MRYSRQEKLVNQEVLKKTKVAVVGVGGLGCPVSTYLALAGVGTIFLIDNDKIELSNLNRQFLFTEKDIGKKKIDVAKKKLEEINPEINIKIFDEINAKSLKVDLILDCLDNWKSRQLLWDKAFTLSKPVVHGAVEGWKGQVAVLLKKEDAVFFQNKKFSKAEKKENNEVVGAIAGLTGSRMALEVLDFLQGVRASKLLRITEKGTEIFPIGVKSKLKYTHAMIRFSEIWLKTTPTRKKMLKLMRNNIQEKIRLKAKQEAARIVVPYNDSFEKLSNVFGVKSFSPCVKVNLTTLEEGFRKYSESVLYPGLKFRVTVKRMIKSGNKTSQQLQVDLGAIAYETGAKVNLTKFDVNIEVEIHKDFAFIFHERMNGPGGFPYGSQGRALCLFSGGIDSPVAAWMVARRGASLDFIFINPLGPALEAKVLGVFSSLKKWIPDSKLRVVDVSKEIEEIRNQVNEGNRQTILKRFMYKVSEKVSRGKPLVTGESLGQVSSQTLKSLTVIQQSIKSLILRPLIGMDKDEIVKLARMIGSFEKSSQLSEYCSLESHSNANPELLEIIQEEKKLDFDYVEIISRIREAKAGEVDISPPDGKFEIVKIWEGIPELEKEKKYLFICKSGNMSDEMALKARKQGFEVYSLDLKQAKKKKFI